MTTYIISYRHVKASPLGKLVGLFLVFAFSANAQYADNLRISHQTNFSYKQLITPSVLMIGGAALSSNADNSIKNQIDDWRDEHMPDFHTTADNYLMFSPIVIAYGLDFCGVKSETDLLNRTIILAKGELLFLVSSQVLKYTTHELRPDGSDYHSFPSGHTAQAFAAATFLAEEYKRKLPWMPYVAYGIATTVGVFRMANDRHYINEVLFGAGLGILSMKVSYWTHQYKWGTEKRKKKEIAWY